MRQKIELVINGKKCELFVKPNETLLDVLRKNLNLKGTKEGCGVGVCGSCTVLMDKKPISSCLTLAVQANGKEILTIEGLMEEEKLHPLQESFLENYAFQCGFCTSGMIMTAKSLLDEKPDPSEEEIREYMSGNICRCTGYKNIIKAIKDVRDGKY